MYFIYMVISVLRLIIKKLYFYEKLFDLSNGSLLSLHTQYYA